ncbi:hypothetical protein FJR41_004275 [Dolichospermum planctonicum UHCC 0167]|uniref:hypothetical protein n=1 Tax=Dolichospermum planctonicum TaxID=136072 RepID=UPI0014432720|nr:hypothetical protein [Dolichospermum planctonicum]MCW9680035.1 hypothetical protein [Dolichospermum planctonicum UHCC 0167]
MWKKVKEFLMAYEIFDPQYRPLDGTMSQVDIAFIPENSQLRKVHFYALQRTNTKANGEHYKWII